jgi:hypothetical protein
MMIIYIYIYVTKMYVEQFFFKFQTLESATLDHSTHDVVLDKFCFVLFFFFFWTNGLKKSLEFFF